MSRDARARYKAINMKLQFKYAKIQAIACELGYLMTYTYTHTYLTFVEWGMTMGLQMYWSIESMQIMPIPNEYEIGSTR